jgi:predicted DNA-binding protein (MmcQ/YjbR family)
VKANARCAARLLQYALAYPEAWEDHPWEETVVKVRKKIFVFTGIYDGVLHCTVKLPESNEEALHYDFVEKTGYGLGKAGWVSARFASGADVPVDLLEEWIDESYRAVAPKTLVKQLDA